MPLRTPDEYRESLRDGRRVYYRGHLVDDVTKHSALGRTIDHAAGLFELVDGQEGLHVYHDEEVGERVSRFFERPTSREALRRRGDLIEDVTANSGTTLNIIKVVGTDALLGLETVAVQLDHEEGTNYLDRVRAFRRHCASNDLAMALAATDAKGDRLQSPSQQSDPESYLRIVGQDSKGITVSGAKLHTTASPSANELIVIPCRAMGENEADWAVAFAIPVSTPGLTLYTHPIDPGPVEEHPISGRHIEVETLTVFDDVRVPWERVFLCGEWQWAGAVAEAFANYHRYTAVSYKPPAIDLLIGAATIAAEQLGLARAAHVRDKIADLICYVELIRAARVAAAASATTTSCDLMLPDLLATNAGKRHFAGGYHAAVAAVQDIAGGLVVTAPGVEDLDHSEHGAVVERYLAGASGDDGRRRWALMQLIRDATASDFGGYNDVVTLHGEGSIQTQRIASWRAFDMDRCRHLVESALLPRSDGASRA